MDKVVTSEMEKMGDSRSGHLLKLAQLTTRLRLCFPRLHCAHGEQELAGQPWRTDLLPWLRVLGHPLAIPSRLMVKGMPTAMHMVTAHITPLTAETGACLIIERSETQCSSRQKCLPTDAVACLWAALTSKKHVRTQPAPSLREAF